MHRVNLCFHKIPHYYIHIILAHTTISKELIFHSIHSVETIFLGWASRNLLQVQSLFVFLFYVRMNVDLCGLLIYMTKTLGYQR